MTYPTDPRVDAYIDALPAWQQAIYRRVRDLVHAADPGVTETIKRTTRPCFVLDGNICALQAAKDHVNVFLYDGAIVPDPEGITGGHDNKTARRVAIRDGQTINAPGAHGRGPADHRRQPGRRLAQAQARNLTRPSGRHRRRPGAARRLVLLDEDAHDYPRAEQQRAGLRGQRQPGRLLPADVVAGHGGSATGR